MKFADFVIGMRVRSKRKAQTRGVGEVVDKDRPGGRIGVRWASGEVIWHFPSEIMRDLEK